MWVSNLQKETLERIKKINNLQRDELVELLTQIADQAVMNLKKTDENVYTGLSFDIIRVTDDYNLAGFKRMFTLAELPGVTLHTLKALKDKGVLEKIELNEVVYWKWTGKELEKE